MSTMRKEPPVVEEFEHRLWQATAQVTAELGGALVGRRGLMARLSGRMSEDGGPAITPAEFEAVAAHVDRLAARTEREAVREGASFVEAVERAVASVLQMRGNRPATTGVLHELTGFNVNVRYFGSLLHRMHGDGNLVRTSGVSVAGHRYYLWSLPKGTL
jgi:hypothetical protein